jgi:hypothetical protein
LGGGGVKRKEKGISNPSLPTESSGSFFHIEKGVFAYKAFIFFLLFHSLEEIGRKP